jgi:hypothetical protein
MSKPSCNKKLRWCLLSVTLIYGVQFLALPACFDQFYPQSNEATAVLLVPLLVMTVIGVLCFDVRIKTWLVSDALYGVLMCAYHGRGLYGIGLRGVMLDGMHPIYSFPMAIMMILALLGAMVILQGLLSILRHWIVPKVK